MDIGRLASATVVVSPYPTRNTKSSSRRLGSPGKISLPTLQRTLGKPNRASLHILGNHCVKNVNRLAFIFIRGLIFAQEILAMAERPLQGKVAWVTGPAAGGGAAGVTMCPHPQRLRRLPLPAAALAGGRGAGPGEGGRLMVWGVYFGCGGVDAGRGAQSLVPTAPRGNGVGPLRGHPSPAPFGRGASGLRTHVGAWARYAPHLSPYPLLSQRRQRHRQSQSTCWKRRGRPVNGT